MRVTTVVIPMVRPDDEKEDLPLSPLEIVDRYVFESHDRSYRFGLFGEQPCQNSFLCHLDFRFFRDLIYLTVRFRFGLASNLSLNLNLGC